jgi:hypothetical protein
MTKRRYALLSLLLLSLTSLSSLSAQTLFVPSSVTDALLPGASTWFSPGCCDLGHTRDNSAMSGTGLAAVHEPCDNSAYFNEFGISTAYSYAQGWSLSTVLPGYDINFSTPVASMNGIAVWNTCYVMPMQGHYQYDANIIQFNAIVTYGGGSTATHTGLTLDNSLTNCAAQQVLFGTTYANVTRVRVVPTSPHLNFRDPSTGGDRNIYVSELRGLLTAVLPVEVTSMTATAEKESVEVMWEIAHESDNHHFTVERSVDHGATWEDLGTVASLGDGSQRQYHFTDYSPKVGIMAYRLSQTDVNGTTSSLRSATVQYWGNEFAAIYPVPVTDNLNVKLIQQEQSRVTVRIFDMTGTLVTEFADQEVAHFDLSLDLTSLTAGRYFVVVSDTQGNMLKKAILKD